MIIRSGICFVSRDLGVGGIGKRFRSGKGKHEILFDGEDEESDGGRGRGRIHT